MDQSIDLDLDNMYLWKMENDLFFYQIGESKCDFIVQMGTDDEQSGRCILAVRKKSHPSPLAYTFKRHYSSIKMGCLNI